MYIAIDLGGTKIAAGLADRSGIFIKKITQKTEQSNATALLDQLAQIITELKIYAKNKKIIAVGIGIPGQLNAAGKIFNMPNIPLLLNINLLRELRKRHKLTYIVDNDANAAALAELYFGAGKKLNSFVYLTISTGIGAGIVLNKKLYQGASNTAGEAGHMIVIPGGPKCGCGNRGCWEAVGSGTALANMAKAKILSGVKTKLLDLCQGDASTINGEMIAAAAKAHDPVALELIDVNGYYNALGITNVVNMLDPDAIIIGGGVSFMGDLFFNALHKCLGMFKILNAKKSIRILRAGCRKDTGLIGALALAKQ